MKKQKSFSFVERNFSVFVQRNEICTPLGWRSFTCFSKLAEISKNNYIISEVLYFKTGKRKKKTLTHSAVEGA